MSKSNLRTATVSRDPDSKSLVSLGPFICCFIKVLLDNGANVDAEDGSGATPLISASAYGYTDVAEVIKMCCMPGLVICVVCHRYCYIMVQTYMHKTRLAGHH